jgi:hypothetical protein
VPAGRPGDPAARSAATSRSRTGRRSPPSRAAALGGKGIDRIVPFGSALSFAAVWDGYDLLHEFTGIMTVTP